MNVFLLILAGILLLIVLLLFCPFVIKLRFDEKLSLKVGYLFPIISKRNGKKKKRSSERQKRNSRRRARTKMRPKKKKRRILFSAGSKARD